MTKQGTKKSIRKVKDMGKVLSLEFSNKYIKMLDGSRSGNSITVNKSILLEVEKGCIDDGKIIDIDSVINTVNEAISKNSIKSRNAIFTIHTNSTVTRNIELPVLKSKSDTMAMIKSELSQLMPVDLNQYKLIYKKTESVFTDGAEKGKYIVYGLPTYMFEQYVLLAEKLKLELIAFELAFNTLDKIYDKKLFINNNPLKSGVVSAFLDIGYDSLTFSVVNNGKNDFSRTSQNGIKDIVKNLGAVHYLSDEEALQEIEKISLLSDDISEISKLNIVEENINIWIDELSRYIRYYNSVNKEKQIEKIYLYGIYSNIKGLPEYIESHINIETVLITLLSNTVFRDKDNESITTYFTTALSLHMDKKDVNFLTDVKKQRKSTFSRRVALLGISTAAVLALALAAYTYYMEKTSLEKDIAVYEAFLNNEDNIRLNNESNALKNKTALMEKYLGEVTKLQTAIKNEDAVTTLIFRQVAAAVPFGTQINAMNVNIDNIQLQCTSVSREEAAQFEKNLNEIDYIDNVYIPTIVEVNDGGGQTYSYSVVCNLKDVITNEAE
jgi:type IV pilus assembly protein PilM